MACGCGVGGRRRRQVQHVGGAGPDWLGRLVEHAAVAAGVALLDQRLDAGARQRADGVGQEAVEPLPARRRVGDSGERRCAGRAVLHAGSG